MVPDIIPPTTYILLKMIHQKKRQITQTITGSTASAMPMLDLD